MIAQQILNTSIEFAVFGTMVFMAVDYLQQISKAVSKIRAEHKAAILASPGRLSRGWPPTWSAWSPAWLNWRKLR